MFYKGNGIWKNLNGTNMKTVDWWWGEEENASALKRIDRRGEVR